MAFHMLDAPRTSWAEPQGTMFGPTAAPQTTEPVVFKPLDGPRATKPLNTAHTSLENTQQQHRRAVYMAQPFVDAVKREPEPEPEPAPPKLKQNKDPLHRLKQAMQKNIM